MHTLFLLLRRSTAFLYDCLLLIAVFFVVTTALVLLNDGENVSHPVFYFLLWVIAGMFFDGFWRHGGQTLGMKAWHLRLTSLNTDTLSHEPEQTSQHISRADTWKRYLLGTLLFGIGYAWAFFDRDGLTAIDRFSGTKIIKDSNHLRNSS